MALVPLWRAHIMGLGRGLFGHVNEGGGASGVQVAEGRAIVGSTRDMGVELSACARGAQACD
jgi:hypothetical protein